MTTFRYVFAVGSVVGSSASDKVSRWLGGNDSAISITEVRYGNATCTNLVGSCRIEAAGGDPTLFHSAGNPPLTFWDFTSVWREVTGSYPELRAVPGT